MSADWMSSEVEVFRKAGRTLIWLYDLIGPAIMVSAPTGIVYENQVYGVSCGHNRLEGYLIPVTTRDANPDIFDPSKNYLNWGNREFRGGTPEQLAEVEGQINEGPGPGLVSELEVTRTGLEGEDNGEAWLWVTFRLEGYAERLTGVLTWANSD